MDCWQLLEELSNAPGDNAYRAYFEKSPDCFLHPIHDWAEFCTRFQQIAGEKLPEMPPTMVGPELLEEQFFHNPSDIILSVVNRNYCPPFLHRLGFVKLVYVIRGHAFFHFRNQKIALHQGCFLIVGPNVEQAVDSCHDEDIVLNLIIRLQKFSESFINFLSIRHPMTDFLWHMRYPQGRETVLLYCGEENPDWTEIILDIFSELNLQPEPSNLICKSLMTILFGEVLRNHGQDLQILNADDKNGPYYLPDLLFYMNSHLACRLPDLCEEFHLSSGYLSRYIRKETGRTFSEILCELRLRQAAHMLVSTDFSIDMIVGAVGYTDKSRFYRNFTRAYGITPLRYRRKAVILRQ